MHFILTLKTCHSFVVSSSLASWLTREAARKLIFQKKGLNLLEWFSIKINLIQASHMFFPLQSQTYKSNDLKDVHRQTKLRLEKNLQIRAVLQTAFIHLTYPATSTSCVLLCGLLITKLTINNLQASIERTRKEERGEFVLHKNNVFNHFRHRKRSVIANKIHLSQQNISLFNPILFQFSLMPQSAK